MVVSSGSKNRSSSGSSGSSYSRVVVNGTSKSSKSYSEFGS